MKRRRSRRNQSNGAPKWMVTYSDMVTLILVFFILLFSMSQIDLAKFQTIAESFRNRSILDYFPSSVPLDNPIDNADSKEDGSKINEFNKPIDLPDKNVTDDSLDLLLRDVEGFLNDNDLNEVIAANRTERGVVLVLQESILFAPGEAEIIDSGKPFLDKIGLLLSEIPNHVKVEGHTDSRPMNSFRYPSNWELSGARASSVIRYLLDNNDVHMSQFSLVGYGETRPILPNTSPENMSKNRRVEIVILNNVLEESGDEL